MREPGKQRKPSLRTVPTMEPLARPPRKQLEDAVVAARDTAEEAARAALMHLGVGDATLPKHLTDAERELRRRLRAHGRQLGDHRRPDGQQAIDKLVQETAYEHWHRRLFARFLAGGKTGKTGQSPCGRSSGRTAASSSTPRSLSDLGVRREGKRDRVGFFDRLRRIAVAI